MKRVFNSLGSNYDFDFVIKTLFSFGKAASNKKLISLLNKKYQGNTILLYKGREAIKLALDILRLPKGSGVGINGFTCYAVYKAVVDAGYKPVYLDIDGRDLNFSLHELESKGKKIKALIVQNTLGNPCNIFDIKRYCDDRNIFLIEDLAHSVGSVYENEREAGTVGDFTALSFSQDKMIDSVSGGALIIRNKNYYNPQEKTYKRLSVKIQLKDRFYPAWTFLIRNFYSFGFGKLLHFGLKKLGMLSQSISDKVVISLHQLPEWYSELAFDRFKNLEINLEHRKMIAKVYADRINKKMASDEFVKKIDDSSNIRFPIFVRNRRDLIDFFKNNGIYVSDIWYDAPIAPKRFLKLTNYSSECPVSEKISSEILNLPTHINVSKDEAIYISRTINKWLNLK